MIRELLTEKLAGDSKAQEAAKRFLELAKQGPYFTGGLGSRDEWHQRR